MITKQERYILRKERTRKKLFKNGINKPRLCVTRTNKYVYAQIIDDLKGQTIAYASTVEKELKERIAKTGKSTKSIEACKILGEVIAKRAVEKGVKEVVFDRGGRLYHGRIKAVAEKARENGLKF
ncbi:MAG: 50S ribosomal protein L18 [Elusimicrobiales bacterium]|nr:50S ribosomal protein L18 [Elusimicrobiales bacterium]